MNAKMAIGAALLGMLALPACAPPPKVLVASSFNGTEKTSKVIIQESGQVDTSTKKKLFNVIVRICDIDPKNMETACKDTVVVQDVVPGSVY
jgi:hypothetical protein